MARSKSGLLILLLCLIATACNKADKRKDFDELRSTVNIDNWQFDLNVENQSKKMQLNDVKGKYLKAILYISNTKTKKSLLYSLSKGSEDYEGKYKYLSFNSNNDLFIKYKDEYIYPIGYVFEPSNGLSKNERLVYKFQLSDSTYNKLMQDSEAVEYWYIDRLIGLGKICFK
jgi:hypothetical protein